MLEAEPDGTDASFSTIQHVMGKTLCVNLLR